GAAEPAGAAAEAHFGAVAGRAMDDAAARQRGGELSDRSLSRRRIAAAAYCRDLRLDPDASGAVGEWTVSGDFPEISATIWRQSNQREGAAGRPAGPPAAGRNHDAEEPNAQPTDPALHRVRARDCPITRIQSAGIVAIDPWPT